jgi:mono/diheme cytochrome c family protein
MKSPLSRSLSAIAALCIASPAFSAAPPKKEEVEDPNAPVSYFKRVRLIFQAECQGCHQPAKAKGG